MHFLQIMGHLGSEPETRMTPSGKKVTNFRVGVKARKGQQEETMWWRVTVWGDQYDKLISYLKKGSAVIVTGEMQPPSTYQANDGTTKIGLEMTAHTINFSPFGKKEESEGGSYQQQQSAPFGAPAGGFRQAAPAPMYGNAQPAMAAAPARGGHSFSEGLEGAGDPSDDDLPF